MEFPEMDSDGEEEEEKKEKPAGSSSDEEDHGGRTSEDNIPAPPPTTYDVLPPAPVTTSSRMLFFPPTTRVIVKTSTDLGVKKYSRREGTVQHRTTDGRLQVRLEPAVGEEKAPTVPFLPEELEREDGKEPTIAGGVGVSVKQGERAEEMAEGRRGDYGADHDQKTTAAVADEQPAPAKQVIHPVWVDLDLIPAKDDSGSPTAPAPAEISPPGSTGESDHSPAAPSSTPTSRRAAEGPQQSSHITTSDRLFPGMLVRIAGLNSAAELNGCLGRVIRLIKKSGRYLVSVARESGKHINVRRANLTPIDAPAEEGAVADEMWSFLRIDESVSGVSSGSVDREAKSLFAEDAAGVVVGSVVVLQNLSDNNLNGEVVRVVGYAKAKPSLQKRVMVELWNRERKSIPLDKVVSGNATFFALGSVVLSLSGDHQVGVLIARKKESAEDSSSSPPIFWDIELAAGRVLRSVPEARLTTTFSEQPGKRTSNAFRNAHRLLSLERNLRRPTGGEDSPTAHGHDALPYDDYFGRHGHNGGEKLLHQKSQKFFLAKAQQWAVVCSRASRLDLLERVRTRASRLVKKASGENISEDVILDRADEQYDSQRDEDCSSEYWDFKKEAYVSALETAALVSNVWKQGQTAPTLFQSVNFFGSFLWMLNSAVARFQQHGALSPFRTILRRAGKVFLTQRPGVAIASPDDLPTLTADLHRHGRMDDDKVAISRDSDGILDLGVQTALRLEMNFLLSSASPTLYDFRGVQTAQSFLTGRVTGAQMQLLKERAQGKDDSFVRIVRESVGDFKKNGAQDVVADLYRGLSEVFDQDSFGRQTSELFTLVPYASLSDEEESVLTMNRGAGVAGSPTLWSKV